MEKKVSILVPIYGVEKYIERCARSLFEQTYSTIEYVFVNDCTKDKSVDILMKVLDDYPHRKEQFKLIHHERNRGLAAARNTAIANMTGEYLLHVDSDDWLELNAVKILVSKALKNNAEIILFGSKNIFVDKEKVSSIPSISKEQYIKSILMHSTPASIWNKFYKADFYQLSGIKSIEGIDHGEDYVVVPRLVHRAKYFMVLNEPLYNYNLTNLGSYTKNISTKSIHSLLLAADELYKYFAGVEDSNIYKKEQSLLYSRTMLALIKMGDVKSYDEIYTVFKPYLNGGINQLSYLDKVIYILLKLRMHRFLFLLIQNFKK